MQRLARESSLVASVLAVGFGLPCMLVAGGCRAHTVIDEKVASVRIARLQSVEVHPPDPVPPEILRWLAVGASGVASDLLPYGIVPAGTPLPHYDDSSPKLDMFHVNDIRSVDDALARELMTWARAAGGGEEHAVCMYPEFGLDVSNGASRAIVLVSISCGKIEVIANATRHDENLTMASVRRFVSLVNRAYGENITHSTDADTTEVTREAVHDGHDGHDGGAP